MDKYYQCRGCGGSVTVNCDSLMCTLPASHRTSGICSGSVSMEITEVDYKQIISQWKRNKRIRIITSIFINEIEMYSKHQKVRHRKLTHNYQQILPSK